MSTKIPAITIAAIIIIGGALLLTSRNITRKTPTPMASNKTAQSTVKPTQENSPMPPAPVTTPSVKINLLAQNNSGESGTAELSDINGKTKVELKLTGAPANVAQPAHIHTGSCANIGGIKYPLTSPLNGVSETMLDVPLSQILGELPLAINVHKSAAEASIYYSCGDITATTGGSTPPASITPPQTTDDSSGGGTFSTPTDRRRGADKPED